jgi:hypothetical protein
MKLPALVSPTLYLAGDIGSSASKFFYRVCPGQTVPLWIGSAVAEGLTPASLPALNSGGRPQDSTWLEVDNQIVLVGDAAKACLDINSLSANKSQNATYKIAAALGVVAELEHLPGRYDAVVWLPLPLTEIRTRDEIAARLTELCTEGFRCRERFQQVSLTLKFFPEGFGLYLNRKKDLEAKGQWIEQRRTLIVMMGHRNLSVLCFEGGSLRAGASNSDGPGFWPSFEKAARSVGVTPADYSSLMTALTSGRTEQISQARAGVFDFGPAAEAVKQTYGQAVSVYLQDNLLKHLADESADVVVSGGASSILRGYLAHYFEQLGLEDRISFEDGMQQHLAEVVSHLPEAKNNPSLALRMADCYGLFQGLIGKLNKVAL